MYRCLRLLHAFSVDVCELCYLTVFPGVWSQVSGYLLQRAQSWANAGVTEDGHCQGACRPQWFLYVPN